MTPRRPTLPAGGASRSLVTPRERWAPYVVVATIGVLFAVGVALGADRQPLVWTVPPLVLTTIILGAIALGDRRSEERLAERAGQHVGLRYLGVQPLPPVTPILSAIRPPRTAHVLAGELGESGVPCRAAVVHTVAHGTLAICITEAPDAETHAADPHHLIAVENNAAPAVVEWLAGHPLGAALATEDGTLVVAAPVRRGEEPPFAVLLAATREARERLATA